MSRTLLIDHRDSYTYNIVDILSEINGRPPTVVTMDSDMPSIDDFDNVVLSPGPGNPYCATDLGITPKVIQAACDRGLPVFGVCMGHQALCARYGKKVLKRTPAHGRVSEVNLTDEGKVDPLLRGVPSSFNVVRYHSLGASMDDEASEDIIPLGYTSCSSTNEGDLLQIFRVRGHPMWGVQFHPESVLTAHGIQILRNFCSFSSHGHKTKTSSSSLPSRPRVSEESLVNGHKSSSSSSSSPNQNHNHNNYNHNKEGRRGRPSCTSHEGSWGPMIRYRRLPGTFDVESVFAMLGEHAFWLDAATKISGRRYSFLGSPKLDGPEAFTLSYYLATKQLFDSRGSATTGTRSSSSYSPPSAKIKKEPPSSGETYQKTEKSFNTTSTSPRHIDNFFDFFDAEMQALRGRMRNNTRLPFELQCGFVGYFSYEMKMQSVNGGNGEKLFEQPPKRARTGTPDAYWRFVDRHIVIGASGDAWLVGLDNPGDPKGNSSAPGMDDDDDEGISMNIHWMDEWEEKLINCAPWEEHQESSEPSYPPCDDAGDDDSLLKEPFVPSKNKDMYVEAIQNCLEAIHEGESYELCLTTQHVSYPHRGNSPINARNAYRRLRRENPAPFGAFLGTPSFSILSSSPERFLKIDGEWAEVKPIKGTIRRGANAEEDESNRHHLATNEKDRAENLMIVDLMRNDLSTFCVPGTVHCPNLMDVEAHPSVFQLVSTIRGRLKPDISTVRAVQRCFPAGSMTGAPKLRAMQILERLEGEPRGIYSGALGFITPTSCDLSVVIRTIVVTPESLNLGAGGAIIALSDPEAEWEEMLLKTRAPVRALSHPLKAANNNSNNKPTKAPPRFHLFETLRVDKHEGEEDKIWFPDEHFERLQKSCAFFSIPCPEKEYFLLTCRNAVEKYCSARVHFNTGGEVRATEIPRNSPRWCFEAAHSREQKEEGGGGGGDNRGSNDECWPKMTFCLDSIPSNTDCFACFHKTTDRAIYDAATERKENICDRDGRAKCDDVLLFNIRGEVTEFTIGNFCMETDEGWVTPPLRSGLLLGVLRNELVASGALKERVVTVHDLLTALDSPSSKIRFARINSVRGIERAELVASDLARNPAVAGYLRE